MNDLPMHWLDMTAIAFIGAAGIVGARAGLLRQLMRLAILFVSASSAAASCGQAADALSRWSGEEVPRIAAAALTFVVVHVVLSLALLVARLLFKGLGPKAADEDDVEGAGALLKALAPRKRGSSMGSLGWLNRLFGAGLAMTIAAVVLGGGVLLADCVPAPEVHGKLVGSKFHRASSETLAAVLGAIPQQDKDELMAALEHFRQKAIQKTGVKVGQAAHTAAGTLNNLPGPDGSGAPSKPDSGFHAEGKDLK